MTCSMLFSLMGYPHPAWVSLARPFSDMGNIPQMQKGCQHVTEPSEKKFRVPSDVFRCRTNTRERIFDVRFTGCSLDFSRRSFENYVENTFPTVHPVFENRRLGSMKAWLVPPPLNYIVNYMPPPNEELSRVEQSVAYAFLNKFMFPKRRFWKAEPTFGNVFSKHFSKENSPNRVLTYVKSALKVRSRMFKKRSKIFAWGA